MAQLQIILPSGELSVHDLAEEKTSIGRLADNSLQLEDGSVSSHHAEIVLEGDSYHLHDLGSTNGTFHNDEQVMDAVLSHGDQVRFGAIEVVFQSEANTSEEPLPASATVSVEAARGSARPAGFVSTSPLPKFERTKDPGALALYAGAGVAALAFIAAVVLVLQMAPPQ